MTSQIDQNSFRNRLHNKRSEPYGFGKDPITGEYDDASSADKLNIEYNNSPKYALLTEMVYNNDSNNFKHILYGPSIDNLELLSTSDYRVDLNASIIWFDQGYEPDTNKVYYAFYDGEGSIIWVEDVTSLQDVVKRIDQNVLYKDGGVMEGSLNMGGFSINNISAITNVNTVDGIKISTHKHAGTLSGDAPQIDVTGLANDAVQTDQIKNDSVTSDKIKDLDVQYFNLATNAVITDKIANGNVTTNKIANGNVTTNKIADSAITYGKLNANDVLAGIFNVLYPIGAIYITTANTCPIANYVGVWTLKSSGRVLQGSDSDHAAGTTIEAGLPNITGNLGSIDTSNNASGAFYTDGKVNGNQSIEFHQDDFYKFNASRVSAIYGNSDTVQPPAYVVNIFERTA